MKRCHLTPLLIFILLLAGCVRRGHSHYPTPQNLVLRPDLLNEEGESLLTEKINSIDVFIYDLYNRPVAHKRVTKSEEERFPDIVFTLDPGRYRVISWGNIEKLTLVSAINEGCSLGESFLETISDVTGSPLYYSPQKVPSERDEPIPEYSSIEGVDLSPYTIDIPPDKVIVKEILFSKAYRTIGIYLKGYEAIYGFQPAKIRLTNMPVRYDFLLRTDPSRKNYEANSYYVITENGQRLVAVFRLMIAPITEDMKIEIVRSSDNETVTTVDLSKYVQDNILDIEDINEFSLEIRYLMSGAVEIAIPGWSNVVIEPEW